MTPGNLRRSCAAHLASVFQLAAEQGADLLLTVKQNQRRLYRQIASQLRSHRHFPVEISDVEASHGRCVRWTRCVPAMPLTPSVSVGWGPLRRFFRKLLWEMWSKEVREHINALLAMAQRQPQQNPS